jgi:hypothetical protein
MKTSKRNSGYNEIRQPVTFYDLSIKTPVVLQNGSIAAILSSTGNTPPFTGILFTSAL